VADQTENGSSFRILTLLDEHTRQACDSSCVVGPSGRCHYGDRSGHSPLWLAEHLRSDKGPEFIGSCMHDWLKAQEIKRVTSSRGPLGGNGNLETFTTSCLMVAITANSSAIRTRRAYLGKLVHRIQ
jgi:hypothetical protein